MGIKRSRGDSLSSADDTSTPYSREPSVDIKMVHLDADSAISHQPTVMKCSLPPHEPLEFAAFEEYDVHYRKAHVNRCSECQRNFPDEHFLHLHISEYHDPINATRRERGEQTYACLLPECDRVCSTPQKRRLHCIDKHQFPKNYNFIIIKDGIDRRTSMLLSPHRRRSSAMSSVNGGTTESGRRRGESNASATGDSMDVAEDDDEEHQIPTDAGQEQVQDSESKRYPARLWGRGGFSHGRGSERGRGGITSVASPSPKPAPAAVSASKDPLETLTSSMSALQFVPHSVRVARGRGRGGGG
ncbi:hypothetical protein T440DRAFT_469540 [Plenodomus tracheiphilus IPT5]|uniref:C2H2-type domain-containing protein n=1 Tax=Plenodomus tracheiphilus IPT5 TaxID=1408161 RepID=A0A6A7B3W1_9PLEO|nr:hypothetical protein T440DRAFT_469540 [Plenodomus tracheiphilus IPT5]